MKKGIILGFLIVFSLLVTTKIVSAIPISTSSQFGGRIVNTTASEIQELEWSGYLCYVPGSTISITPIGSPAGTPQSYFIPFGEYSKTGYSPSPNQLIIGKYGPKASINCTLSYPPYTTVPVFLDTITTFGTSAGFGGFRGGGGFGGWGSASAI